MEHVHIYLPCSHALVPWIAGLCANCYLCFWGVVYIRYFDTFSFFILKFFVTFHYNINKNTYLCIHIFDNCLYTPYTRQKKKTLQVFFLKRLRYITNNANPRQNSSSLGIHAVRIRLVIEKTHKTAIAVSSFLPCTFQKELLLWSYKSHTKRPMRKWFLL
jgi:hypothetical protein